MKTHARREAVRSEIKTILKNLDPRWLRAASAKISQNLTSIVEDYYAEASAILAWTTFFQGEPDMSEFIARQIMSRKVYLPRSLPDFSLDFILVNTNWQASLNSGIHGIPEPLLENSQKYDNIFEQNLILVPGLAFDRSGNRLGRGKGYYDRFLSKPENKNLVKIGVCLSLQVFEQIDVKAHDVPVNWICTEDEVIKV